jgi:DNA-binding IclR family transcriptional regulator
MDLAGSTIGSALRVAGSRVSTPQLRCPIARPELHMSETRRTRSRPAETAESDVAASPAAAAGTHTARVHTPRNAIAVPVSGTQAARRIVDLLKLMASHRGNGLRFVEIADLSRLERPTVHRMLKTLVAEGMVFREDASKRYFLGPLLLELGLAAARQFKLGDLCTPSLRRLAELTGDTSFLFVRSGIDAVCLERIQGSYPIQTPSVPVGSRQPLGVSAGGLALLSTLPDAEIGEIIAANEPHLAEYGGLTSTELARLVKDSQRRKYAVIGERAVPGVTAVGIAIRGRTNISVAALAIAAITGRMTPKRQKEIMPLLKQSAEEISKLLLQQ